VGGKHSQKVGEWISSGKVDGSLKGGIGAGKRTQYGRGKRRREHYLTGIGSEGVKGLRSPESPSLMWKEGGRVAERSSQKGENLQGLGGGVQKEEAEGMEVGREREKMWD